jgi:hypothetical protein
LVDQASLWHRRMASLCCGRFSHRFPQSCRHKPVLRASLAHPSFQSRVAPDVSHLL